MWIRSRALRWSSPLATTGRFVDFTKDLTNQPAWAEPQDSVKRIYIMIYMVKSRSWGWKLMVFWKFHLKSIHWWSLKSWGHAVSWWCTSLAAKGWVARVHSGTAGPVRNVAGETPPFGSLMFRWFFLHLVRDFQLPCLITVPGNFDHQSSINIPSSN